MATNNIKIFDQNKANMLTDEAYNTSTQRLNGVQQGIASSQLQNKTLYQVSLVAYAIGQMMQANGLNANDADAVSTFAGNLSNTIVQKILDKADATEAKNFTVNNKFITPQTWKVAYDFMKADSDMVTSAVDDIHYITPKLLKEGAEKYGDKVRLDDGSLVSGIKIGSINLAKNKNTFITYPVLNNKAYIIYSNDAKTVYLVNTLNDISEIASISFPENPTIGFADEEWLIVSYTENNAKQIAILHLEDNNFVQKLKQTMPVVGSRYYYGIQQVVPSFINCTNNIINLMYSGADRNGNVSAKIAAYNKSTNELTYGDIQDFAGGQGVTYFSFVDDKQRLACCYARRYESTSHGAVIIYMNNLNKIEEASISIATSSSSYATVNIISYWQGYVFALLDSYNCYKVKLSDNSYEMIKTNINLYVIMQVNDKIIFLDDYPAGRVANIISKETNEVITRTTTGIAIKPATLVSTSDGLCIGFPRSMVISNVAKVYDWLFVSSQGFIFAYSVDIVGFNH